MWFSKKAKSKIADPKVATRRLPRLQPRLYTDGTKLVLVVAVDQEMAGVTNGGFKPKFLCEVTDDLSSATAHAAVEWYGQYRDPSTGELPYNSRYTRGSEIAEELKDYIEAHAESEDSEPFDDPTGFTKAARERSKKSVRDLVEVPEEMKKACKVVKFSFGGSEDWGS